MLKIQEQMITNQTPDNTLSNYSYTPRIGTYVALILEVALTCLGGLAVLGYYLSNPGHLAALGHAFGPFGGIVLTAASIMSCILTVMVSIQNNRIQNHFIQNKLHLESQITEKTAECENINKNLSDITKDYADYRGQTTEEIKEITKINDQLRAMETNLRERCSALETSLQQASTSALNNEKRRQQTLTELREEIERKDKELRDISGRLEQSVRQLDETVKANAQLKAANVSLGNEKEKTETNLRQGCSALETSLQQASTSAFNNEKQYKQILTELREEIERKNKELRDISARLEQSARELEETVKANAQLKAASIATENQYAEEVISLKNQLTKLNQVYQSIFNEKIVKTQSLIRSFQAKVLLQTLQKERQVERVGELIGKTLFQICGYLSKGDRNSLSLTNKACRIQRWEWIVLPYAGIRADAFIASMQLSTTQGNQSIRVKRALGFGGCKMAWLLENGQALLLPNTSADPLIDIKKRWSRIVREEKGMSKRLTQLNLLNPRLEEVNISFNYKGQNVSLPAYTCQSFQALAANEGIYVIDSKNSESSTWVNRSLFNSAEERNCLEKWDPIVLPLIEDVKKLKQYGIPVDTDSENVAVQMRDSRYVIRYFGFDFSAKHKHLYIPQMYSETYDKKSAYELFCTLFREVLLLESRYLLPPKEKLSRAQKRQMGEEEKQVFKKAAKNKYKVEKAKVKQELIKFKQVQKALIDRYKNYF